MSADAVVKAVASVNPEYNVTNCTQRFHNGVQPRFQSQPFLLPGSSWPAPFHFLDVGLGRFIRNTVANRSILDVGAGSGQYGAWFARANEHGGPRTRWSGIDGAANVESFTRAYGPRGAAVKHANICGRSESVAAVRSSGIKRATSRPFNDTFACRCLAVHAPVRLGDVTRGRRALAHGLRQPLLQAAQQRCQARAHPLLGACRPERALPRERARCQLGGRHVWRAWLEHPAAADRAGTERVPL